MEEVFGFILELCVDLLSHKKKELDATGKSSKTIRYLYAIVILLFLIVLLVAVLFIFNIGGVAVKIASSIVGIALFCLLISEVVKVLKSSEDKDHL